MERHDIGPRIIGGHLAYHRAVVVEEPRRWLMLSGHEARDDEGRVAHRGDIRGQIELTCRRLGETLEEAGFAFSDVVQIRVFTIDLPAMTANYDALTAELERRGCGPTSLLAGVSALSDPDMLVEIEAVAAQ
ncbi:Rid family hydrolase [Streptomyces sp. NPDC057654]|uniref:Rid family hydrolase n=1 Tax=Streptomyces sp. NPDC057654 TaxID=3346196 RepID=UPI0036845E6F